MRGIFRSFGLGAALLLGSCGQEHDGHADHAHDEIPEETLSAEETIVAPTLTQIPARFLGDWDTPEGNCAQYSETMMSIGESEIVYYESVGAVKDVRPADAEGVTVTLAMSGEGESWERSETFYLFDGGTSLVDGNETIRKRCS